MKDREMRNSKDNETKSEGMDSGFICEIEEGSEYYGYIAKDRGGPRYIRYEIGPIETVFEELCSNGQVPGCDILLQECKKKVGGYKDYYNLDNTPEPVESELEDAVLYIYPYLVRRYVFLSLCDVEPGIHLVDFGKNFMSEAIQFKMNYKGKMHRILIYDEDSQDLLEKNIVINKCMSLGCVIPWNESPIHSVLFELSSMDYDLSDDESTVCDSRIEINKPEDLTEIVFPYSNMTSLLGDIKVYDRRHLDFIIESIT